MLKRVITSLVYEICEFFAKRYLRKGIAMVKNRSLHLFAKRNEYNTCLFIFFLTGIFSMKSIALCRNP